MGHTHAHESYLSLPLKLHDLKREGNISLENVNVVHLVHINSVHEFCIYFSLGKNKNGAWEWCAPFFILRICSLAIRTTSNLLTVVPSRLFFLGMKHDLENTADLEGVLCVSGSIFRNYTLYLFFCPAQGELTVRKKVFNRHVVGLYCPAFMCLVRHVQLFILIFSPCCCSSFSEKCAAQSSRG